MQMRTLGTLLVLAMAMAGCSGGGGEGEGDGGDGNGVTPPSTPPSAPPSTPPTPPSPPPAPPPSPPEEPRDPVTWDITIQGTAFVDGSITIQVGDTVRWTHNDGTTTHNVRSTDAAAEEFYSGGAPYMTDVPTRDTFTHTFEVVGEDPYVCEVHASMSETITVLEVYDETPE